MKFKTMIAASVAVVLSMGAASAATVSLSSSVGTLPLSSSPVSPVGQDFVNRLQNAGADTLYSGPLTLTLSGPARLTFSLVGAESDFSNSLLFDGSPVITENYSNTGLADFSFGALGGQIFETFLGAGAFQNRLSFSVNGGGNPTFNSGDDEFGIFAKAADIGALKTFFLALDDSGANEDDNHDDIIIRVNVSAVPLPAAGWLLLAGLGGLGVMRRLRKA